MKVYELTQTLATLQLILTINSFASVSEGDWCRLDTGPATVTDRHGYRHNVHVSVTRDGSVWLRLGQDHSSFDWSLHGQHRTRVQSSILDDDMVNTLQAVPFLEFCVITDLDLEVKVEGGWHPSYVTVFDPKSRETRIISIKNIRDCKANTTLSLTPDKQSIRCSASSDTTACGLRNVPPRGHRSSTWFIKYVNLDLIGSDHWYCTGHELKNVYTFAGSFYHAYVKLAECDVPKDSRANGNDAKLRSRKDSVRDAVILPDPTDAILTPSTIQAWHFYAQIVSEQHSVYLQVWRPTNPGADHYTLVGQTHIHPSELRFHELVLSADQFVRTEGGDVLGLFFPKYNPIGWSAVPCVTPLQRHRYVDAPDEVVVGKTLHFKTSTSAIDACRHYSLKALFANKTGSKYIEGWVCPSRPSSFSSSLGQSGTAELKTSKDNTDDDDDDVDDDNEKMDSGRSANPEAGIEQQGPGLSEYSMWVLLTDPSGYAILAVLLGLLLTMSAVGLASYCRAVHS